MRECSRMMHMQVGNYFTQLATFYSSLYPASAAAADVDAVLSLAACWQHLKALCHAHALPNCERAASLCLCSWYFWRVRLTFLFPLLLLLLLPLQVDCTLGKLTATERQFCIIFLAVLIKISHVNDSQSWPLRGRKHCHTANGCFIVLKTTNFSLATTHKQFPIFGTHLTDGDNIFLLPKTMPYIKECRGKYEVLTRILRELLKTLWDYVLFYSRLID